MAEFDELRGLCRAVTSAQIAKATEAERAEARSLSADRRQKLKLELGDGEGISTLLENSLLGASGGDRETFLFRVGTCKHGTDCLPEVAAWANGA